MTTNKKSQLKHKQAVREATNALAGKITCAPDARHGGIEMYTVKIAGRELELFFEDDELSVLTCTEDPQILATGVPEEAQAVVRQAMEALK